jgi:DNA-binding NarL/FixJ family response regulator
MITSIESDQRMLDALRVGADGFCFKEVSADQLIKVVNNVVAGGVWLDPVVSRRILGSAEQASPENPQFPNPPLKIQLSEHETELLALQSEALDNQEIADRMGVKRDEVVAMIKQIIAKLLSKQNP